MRILHVAPCYAPAWAYGGPVRAVTGLTREQARRGHEVRVYTTDAFIDGRTPIRNADESGDAGVEVRRFPVVSDRLARSTRLVLAPHFKREVARAVRGADVVHIHEHRTLQAVSAGAACRRFGVPYVLSPHGSLPVVVQRRLAKRLFDRLLGNGVVAGAAGFVAVSAMEREQLRAYGVDDREIREIPNALEDRFFRPLPEPGAFRARHGLQGAELLLFVGRVHAQKGLATLLDAFALLSRTRAESRLVIAGPDDGYAGELRRALRRLALESRVLLMEPLQDEDKVQAYVDADVVVYPSAYEIFGLVPLEAIACGTPAVVCAGSASARIVADLEGGVAVRPDDPGDLANGLVALLDAPGFCQGVKRSRGLVAKRYGWSSVAAQVEDLYAHCIAVKARAQATAELAPSTETV